MKRLIDRVGKGWATQSTLLPEHQLYRLLEWRRLREVLADLEINCILDVGAARGQFASNLRQIGYEGLIVSFEPVAEAFAEMSQAFATDALWRGYNIALGRQDTDIAFQVAIESTEMSSVWSPLDESWKLQQVVVPMRRLDSLRNEIIADFRTEPRIFLKMDTQGYDVEVIHGAADCLEGIAGLQSELSVLPQYQSAPHYLFALQLYGEMGFQPVSIIEAARDPVTGIITEFNSIFVRYSTV